MKCLLLVAVLSHVCVAGIGVLFMVRPCLSGGSMPACVVPAAGSLLSARLACERYQDRCPDSLHSLFFPLTENIDALKS